MGLFWTLPASLKVLLINNLGFSIGFYMILPYLAKHLTGSLGFSASFAGFIIGFRMLSQQGLFLLGGTLADRFNYQSVIMVGCAIRVMGFGLFGYVVGPFGVVLAAFLTGFAGALFSPACQAFLARLSENHPQREKVYALHNLTTQVGAFSGPLIALLLLKYGFSFLCYTSAAVFFMMLLLQWRYLPHLEGSEHDSTLSVWEEWAEVLRLKNFIRFCLLMSVYYLMFNQFYVLLPLGVPDEESVAAMFTLSAIVGVTLQMPLSSLMIRFLSRSARLGTGLALMACSFPLLNLRLGAIYGIPLAPFATVALLTLGVLIVLPPALSMIPEFCGERHQGVAFGVFYFFGGITGALGSGLAAWLWEWNVTVLLLGLLFLGLLFAALLWRQTLKLEKA